MQDTLLEGAVSLVYLAPEDMQGIVAGMRQFRLDFDDAYQYVAAEKHSLFLVSFDADFDRTERGERLLRQFFKPDRHSMSGYEVPEPILNSPFDEPTEHWHIAEGEQPERRADRRPAMYFYRIPIGFERREYAA